LLGVLISIPDGIYEVMLRLLVEIRRVLLYKSVDNYRKEGRCDIFMSWGRVDDKFQKGRIVCRKNGIG
jgi:hypothetical protein